MINHEINLNFMTIILYMVFVLANAFQKLIFKKIK
jgi:hypothetical protein